MKLRAIIWNTCGYIVHSIHACKIMFYSVKVITHFIEKFSRMALL